MEHYCDLIRIGDGWEYHLSSDRGENSTNYNLSFIMLTWGLGIVNLRLGDIYID